MRRDYADKNRQRLIRRTKRPDRILGWTICALGASTCALGLWLALYGAAHGLSGCAGVAIVAGIAALVGFAGAAIAKGDLR